MILQNKAKLFCFVLTLLVLIHSHTAIAVSLDETLNQRYQESAEQFTADDELSKFTEPQKDDRGSRNPDSNDNNSENASQQSDSDKHHPSDEQTTITKVHEFHAQSDENGIKLVPALQQAIQTPAAKATQTPTATSLPTAVPATLVPLKAVDVKDVSQTTRKAVMASSKLIPPTAVQPSFDSFATVAAAMGLKPISSIQAAQNGQVVATPVVSSALIADEESAEQHTLLTTSPQLSVQPVVSVEVSARLFTENNQPLINEEIVLLTDDTQVQQAETDTDGTIRFQLPDDLTIGDHTLKFIYAGGEGFLPAVAESVIHYHTDVPGSTSAQDASLSGQPIALSSAARAVSSINAVSPTKVTLLNPEIGVTRTSFIPAFTTVWDELGASAALWFSRFSLISTIVPDMSQGNSSPAFLSFILLGAVVLAGVALVAAPFVWRRQNWLVLPVRRPMPTFPKLNALSLPMSFWYVMRIISVGCALGLAIVLFVRPERGLFIFWRLFIPFVPLLFFVAPALWRNICPMAALNQTPRLFNFSKAWTTPKWMQRYGYLISISLFVVLVSSRKVLFNTNGTALAILILCSLAAAFVMGNFFKGKSGWCSSICPLLPVQRIYGQTPFVTVNHAHCQPCLGCTKNCYDLSPKNAYLADLYDDDRQFAGFRKAFVGLFPGFVLAFYLLPNPPVIAIWQMYAAFVVIGGLSMLSFFAMDRFLPVSSNKITVLYGAAALNAYYWFNSLSLGTLLDTQPPAWFVWPLRTLVLGLTLFWIYRTWQKEQPFIELTLAPQTFHSEFRTQPQEVSNGVRNGSTSVKTQGTSPAASGKPEVIIEPEGKRITVESSRTLLEIIESNNLPIETGCRMGLCGADPICVHEGMENLSKVGSDERNTLDRLALAPNTRMACMARVRGNVKIGLAPGKPDIYQSSIVAGFKYDKAVQRVVIVGNGIAGVTAADHVRRRHPHCEIYLIGRERHHLYNRMGIARLIYGRSAMQGLYLLSDQWYDDFNITSWLNTHVTKICREEQSVTLGTGEKINYDRLILTTGSQSFIPPIVGFGLAGSFVLRSADDAMAIRAYVQEHGAHNAVVAGGGLLGLEAAYALHKLGMAVTVLERSGALLSRQLDTISGQFLCSYLEKLGIQVVMEAEVEMLLDGSDGKGRADQVQLKNGRRLPCDLLLVAAGIAPDVELARSSGLKVNRAVVVDSQMRTSDPYIFAAGDVAEYDEKVYGLWPVAVSQAEVAAAGVVAGPGVSLADYIESAPVTMLKVAGIDVTSIGRIKAQTALEEELEEEIVFEEHATHRYRKLVIANGKIVGAILLDAQQDAPGVTEAIKQQLDITQHLDELRQGNWEALHELA